MATHSSILAWRIPWKKEPHGLQSMGSQTVRHDWTANTCTFSYISIKRNGLSEIYEPLEYQLITTEDRQISETLNKYKSTSNITSELLVGK